MTAPARDHEPLVDQLMALVDETIAFQEEAIVALRDLSAAVTARDEAALERLGETLRQAEARLGDIERRRDRLRAQLAVALAWTPHEVTLARLARHAGEPRAGALRQRRDRAIRVAGSLRGQHLKTATLLTEFVRAGRAILTGLLSQGGDARTYRTDGTAPWWPEQGLLDARR